VHSEDHYKDRILLFDSGLNLEPHYGSLRLSLSI